MRGQAIVEFALIAPVTLFTALGFIEAGFLVAEKGSQDRATGVVAQWIASHPGEDWVSIVADQLPGCDIVIAEVMDIVTVKSTCDYEPIVTHGLWGGLPISSEESSVVIPSIIPLSSPDTTRELP